MPCLAHLPEFTVLLLEPFLALLHLVAGGLIELGEPPSFVHLQLQGKVHLLLPALQPLILLKSSSTI